MKKGDTIEEIAGYFDIPAEELQNTINKINGYAENQTDLDFNRGRLTAFSEGPYYIQKAAACG